VRGNYVVWFNAARRAAFRIPSRRSPISAR
jgi:hypothetical protein